MIEHGTVVEIKGELAVVELEKAEACEHCRTCISIGDGKMRMETRGVPDLSIGDRVDVEIPVARLKAVLLVFVMPLAAVLVGAVLGRVLGGVLFPDGRYSNLFAIAFALGFVVLAFVGIYVYERRKGAEKSRPYIITVHRGEE